MVIKQSAIKLLSSDVPTRPCARGSGLAGAVPVAVFSCFARVVSGWHLCLTLAGLHLMFERQCSHEVS